MPHAEPTRLKLRAVAPALLAVVLAACSAAIAPLPPPTPSLSMTAAPTCRVAPDGGPPAPGAAPNRTAERGIGGTGAPTALAERGIGGTGIGNTGISSTGISSTGIIGVITGFGSICLAGHEVGFDPDLRIAIDGHPASTAALRAGQVAAIDATGPAESLHASRIVIRNEASGVVQSIDADGALRVAGQRVLVTAATLGATAPSPGDWVVVSGLRDPDGTIQATRIDLRAEGEAVIHGVMTRAGSTWRIGTQEVRPAPGQRPLPGQQVTAAGRTIDGVLFADIIEPDAILQDPVVYFGPAAQVVIVESFAGIANGHLVLNRMRQDRGLGADHQVVEFERRRDGGLQPVSIRPAPPRATSGGNAPRAAGMARDSHTLEPAPVPGRMDRSGFGPAPGAGAAPKPGTRPSPGHNERYDNQPDTGFYPGAPSFNPASPPAAAGGRRPG